MISVTITENDQQESRVETRRKKIKRKKKFLFQVLHFVWGIDRYT